MSSNLFSESLKVIFESASCLSRLSMVSSFEDTWHFQLSCIALQFIRAKGDGANFEINWECRKMMLFVDLYPILKLYPLPDTLIGPHAGSSQLQGGLEAVDSRRNINNQRSQIYHISYIKYISRVAKTQQSARWPGQVDTITITVEFAKYITYHKLIQMNI